MTLWTPSSLVSITACRLFGAKPLFESKIPVNWTDLNEISIKIRISSLNQQMSCAKWRLFRFKLNVLTNARYVTIYMYSMHMYSVESMPMHQEYFFGIAPEIAKFMGPTWGPPGSCRPPIGPMLAQWTLLSGPFFYSTSQFATSIVFPLSPVAYFTWLWCPFQ